MAGSKQWLALVALLGAGCFDFADDDGPLPAASECDPTESAGQNLDAVPFDALEAPCLGLRMDAAEYDELRMSNRFDEEDPLRALVRRLTTDCTTPFPSEYPRFEASVTFADWHLGRVGIRKKGFLGTVTGHGEQKPSFKLDTDEFVPNQSLGADEHLTLNNNAQDATRLKTCLAYELFAAAGYPAPLCNVAGVMMNGAPLGAYAHVEPIKKSFLRRAFGNDSGSLYEGAVVDLTPEFLTESTGLGRWESKTDESDASGAPLAMLTRALEVPAEDLLEALEPHLDVDLFISFWALEMLIDHRDGYAANRNNFYVYFDPANEGRAVFVPWGADDIFADAEGDDAARVPEDYLFAELPRRLSRLPSVRARFERRMTELLETVWDEAELLESIDRYARRVRKLQRDPHYEQRLDVLRAWIENRRSQLASLLASGLPPGAEETASCFTIGLGSGLEEIQRVADGVGTYTFVW
jgi:spore coat protein CotH